MPITTNSGGVLHNLSPIYVRNGGILNELTTVYANTGGALSTIYEKNSGSEETPIVQKSFDWAYVDGMPVTPNPVSIGTFTIDQPMDCTYTLTTHHSMEDLCPCPSPELLKITAEDNELANGTMTQLRDTYYYDYSIRLKKSNDLNATDYITWKGDNSAYITYNYNLDTGYFEYLKKNVPTEFNTSIAERLEVGTYYLFFYNRFDLYTEYNYGADAESTKKNFIAHMAPYDMSVSVTLNLKPITT